MQKLIFLNKKHGRVVGCPQAADRHKIKLEWDEVLPSVIATGYDAHYGARSIKYEVRAWKGARSKVTCRVRRFMDWLSHPVSTFNSSKRAMEYLQEEAVMKVSLDLCCCVIVHPLVYVYCLFDFQVDRRVVDLLASADERGLLSPGCEVHVEVVGDAKESTPDSDVATKTDRMQLLRLRIKQPQKGSRGHDVYYDGQL